MKFQSLKAQSATLALSLLALCGTFTSCVEDEENPFRDDDYDEEYAQLPGNGEFYIGSIVEMRGRGFLPSDQVWVRDSYTGQLLQARTTDCTGDKLFFVIPTGLTPNNSVEVSITQGDDTEIIGYIYVQDLNMDITSSDFFYYAEEIAIYGEISPDDKVYYQDAEYDAMSGNFIPLGDVSEATILYRDETKISALAYPLTNYYIATFEHNGETAKSLQMSRAGASYFTESAKEGETVTIKWQGVKAGDSILIDDYSGSYVVAESSINGSVITFTVPHLPENVECDIMIKRYENHAPTKIGTIIVESN